MPGGQYHFPVFRPYALYGTVDHVYGWPAWDSHSGFTAAQASLNVVETAMYIYYLAVIWKSAAKDLYGFRDAKTLFLGNQDKTVSGPGIAKAALVLFSALVMTISKTVLYCKLMSNFLTHPQPPYRGRRTDPSQGPTSTFLALQVLATTALGICSGCGFFPMVSGSLSRHTWCMCWEMSS